MRNSQYGFVKNKYQANLIFFYDRAARLTGGEREVVAVVYNNLNKAFGIVLHDIVLSKLQKYD